MHRDHPDRCTILQRRFLDVQSRSPFWGPFHARDGEESSSTQRLGELCQVEPEGATKALNACGQYFWDVVAGVRPAAKPRASGVPLGGVRWRPTYRACRRPNWTSRARRCSTAWRRGRSRQAVQRAAPKWKKRRGAGAAVGRGIGAPPAHGARHLTRRAGAGTRRQVDLEILLGEVRPGRPFGHLGDQGAPLHHSTRSCACSNRAVASRQGDTLIRPLSQQ